jgi:hypothetical protein
LQIEHEELRRDLQNLAILSAVILYPTLLLKSFGETCCLDSICVSSIQQCCLLSKDQLMWERRQRLRLLSFWELKASMLLLEALFNDVSDSQVKPFQCSNLFGTLKPGQCASSFITFVRDIHTSVPATMPLA